MVLSRGGGDDRALALLATAALVLGLRKPRDRLALGRRERASVASSWDARSAEAASSSASGRRRRPRPRPVASSACRRSVVGGRCLFGLGDGLFGGLRSHRLRLLGRLFLRGCGLLGLGFRVFLASATGSASAAGPRSRRSPRPRPRPASSVRLFDLGVLCLVSHVATFPRSRSFWTVRMRAISRLAWRRRALFSSTPVAVWKCRLKSSWRVSAILRSSSSSVSALSSLALKEIRLPAHELRLERQLLPGEAERLLGERLVDAGELEHHATRLDDGDPALG